jgi:hypothetical protein
MVPGGMLNSVELLPPFIAYSETKARKTLPFQVRLRTILQSFSQTESLFQRAHHRQMRYALEPYPAPSWNIGRICVWSEFSILYLGTMSDFTANSELMILFASLSSMLKLFTSVSLLMGLSTFLSFTLVLSDAQ